MRGVDLVLYLCRTAAIRQPGDDLKTLMGPTSFELFVAIDATGRTMSTLLMIRHETTRLLLLRHAETAAPDRFHGAESDIELGERGQRQANVVAQALALENADRLYCSGMLRAIETAAAIALTTGLNPIIIPEFHERKMGPLSGKAYSDTSHHYQESRTQWMAGDLDATHVGGESYAQVRDRVLPRLRAVLDAEAGKTIVVVIHGMVMRVIFSEWLEGYGLANFVEFPTENAAINDLKWDGERLHPTRLNLIPDLS